jgi:hypothetical protein
LLGERQADKGVGVAFYRHIPFGSWLPCPDDKSGFRPFSFAPPPFDGFALIGN